MVFWMVRRPYTWVEESKVLSVLRVKEVISSPRGSGEWKILIKRGRGAQRIILSKGKTILTTVVESSGRCRTGMFK